MDEAPLPPPEPPPEPCAGCGRPLKPGATFCSACGRRRGTAGRAPETSTDRRRRFERAWQDLRGMFGLYALLLATSALAIAAARLTETTFWPMAGATAVDALIIVVAAWRRRGLVVPTFRRAGFGPLGWAGVAALAPVVLVAVSLYVKGLSWTFGLKEIRLLEESEGLATALLLDVACPAFFEEVAFRGVIFGVLRRHVPLRDALLVSSFAFAILHLSVPSLVTHLPMGLWFCWLRHRSGSLWPSVLAHALHNGGVVALEAAGWL